MAFSLTDQITTNMAEQAPSTSPAKRASCDRCHAHKIRCSRSTLDDSVSCARCHHLGRKCVYSAPMPKGRPSGSRKSSNTSYTPPKEIALLPQTQQTLPRETENLETIDELWSTLEVPDMECNMETWSHLGARACPSPVMDATLPITTDPTMAACDPSTSADSFSREDVCTASMQLLAALSVDLCTLHDACRNANAGLEQGSLHVSHANAFIAVSDLLADVPNLYGYEIFSEACRASRNLLRVMHTLRLFDDTNEDTLRAFEASTSSSSVSGLGLPSTSNQLMEHQLHRADNQQVPVAGSYSQGCDTPPRGLLVSTECMNWNIPGSDIPGSAPDPRFRSQHESTTQVLRHLFAACYVQILHVHTVLVRLMLHEASNFPGIEPFSFAQLRLTVISNLISHLLDHMRRGFATCRLATIRSDSDAAGQTGGSEIRQLEQRLWRDLGDLKMRLTPASKTPSSSPYDGQ